MQYSRDQLTQPQKDDQQQSDNNKIDLQPAIGWQKYFLQVKLLLQKNIIIYKRNYCSTLFLLLSPVLVCMLIIIQQKLSLQLTQFLIVDPQVSNVDILPKCQPPQQEYSPFGEKDSNTKNNSCLTIGYGVIGPNEQWIDFTMKYVARKNNLTFGQDIKLVSQGSPHSFMNYLKTHANQTQIGVIFCTSEWPLLGNDMINIPCKFDNLKPKKKLIFYSVVYNWTLNWKSPFFQDQKASYPKDGLALRLKQSIDNALFEFFEKNTIDVASKIVPYNEYLNVNNNTLTNKKSTLTNKENNLQIQQEQLQQQLDEREKVTIYQQDYPKLPSRFAKGYDVSTGSGAFFFFIPIMIHFIMTVNEILREKEKRLRMGMSVMGMTHYAYWSSWFINSIIINVIMQLVLIMSGIFLDFDFFVKAPIPISFSILFGFGMSMQAIAYFISTISSDSKGGYTIAYGFLLLAIVMELFLSSGWLIYFLYREDADWFQHVLKKIFFMYPAFHYSKIYNDVSRKTNMHYQPEEGRWVEGVGFDYETFFQKSIGKLTLPKPGVFIAPSPFESLIDLSILTLVTCFLVWYCDNIIASNRGTSQSAFFFLTREYWGITQQYSKKIRKESDTALQVATSDQQFDALQFNYQNLNIHDSVKVEKDRVRYNSKNHLRNDGLRIQRLCKTYNKYPFGIKSSKDVEALKDVFLEVNKNELLVILGHNGAGKSTLINVLTGLLAASSGTAEILGFDISGFSGLQAARQVMGVCPQFDVIWEELSAEEHLKMFCLVKGVAEKLIEDEISKRLREVRLSHVRKATVSTFSGGMRRRISLAISAIGNPKVIFMDEPTTGMDPKTRRQVWQMIKNLKKDRVLILTTHSMEEADALSDRIAVIANGCLKCIGTSLYLKNNFGDGYRLTLVTEPQEVDYARAGVKELIPSSTVIDQSGGSLIISVPLININEMSNFFQVMEDIDQSEKATKFKKLIKDWGLSHTTLEEVFIKITRDKQGQQKMHLSSEKITNLSSIQQHISNK